MAYSTIILLQLRLLWDVWRYKDVTSGDTANYYADAAAWTHGLHDNIVWSPLYTDYVGTLGFFIKDVPTLIAVHRVLIVLTAAALVLMLMRALLGPAVGLLIAIWWTVLPPNFNVQYEVHLFALIPILIAAIIVVRWSGRNSRGAALALLVATAILIRNELLIASVVFAGAIVVAELRARRSGPRVSVGTYVRAYAVPLAVVLVVTLGVYSRSTAQGSTALSVLHSKQGLNVCQVYALSYQQRHPARFTGNPWTDCGPLLTATFGKSQPTFSQAFRANPNAMARFVGWNARLLPNGLQVSLFGASSGGVNTDYFLVKLHRRYALVLSLLTLLIVAAGILALRKQSAYWRNEWLPGRVWSVVLLSAVSLTALVLGLTERPRSEYLYGLTISLMAAVGLCGSALLRRFGRASFASVLAAGVAVVLLLAVHSHYHAGPRPIHDALERLAVVKARLQVPHSVLITSSYNSDICLYLASTVSRDCTSPDWAALTQKAGRRSIVHALNDAGASVIYADPVLSSDPVLAPLLAKPGDLGWRTVAAGKDAGHPWSVLVRHKLPGPPTSLALPRDLARPGFSYGGIYKDGWSRRTATLVLAGGPRETLNLTALVLALPGGRPEHLEILMNGRRVAAATAAPGTLAITRPLPASHGVRHIQLRWSSTTAISSRDPRQAAALLQLVGLTSRAAPAAVRFPQALLIPGLAEKGVFSDGWTKQDAALTLAGGSAATLEIQAATIISGQHLDVRVNGVLIHSAPVEQNAVDLRVPVAASSGSRRIQLHWSREARISANDPRHSSARLELVAID